MRALVVLVVGCLAGCSHGGDASGAAAAPSSRQASPDVQLAAHPAGAAVDTPATLQPDLAKAQALLRPEETLDSLTFDANGAATAQGSVDGYKSTAWAVAVPAGRALTVSLASANQNISFDVWDVNVSGAVHRGEVDGREAIVKSSADTTYLIRPGLPRAMARRDEQGEYTLQLQLR
ncbi:MAG TPA: hypothetical protein VNQ81_12900 [Povalibacter sp.]|nr:hypothetical protein [Povalibacter sp.]